MTIDEAIRHCLNVAETCTVKECAEDYRQLAEWLRDYQKLLTRKSLEFELLKDGTLVVESDIDLITVNRILLSQRDTVWGVLFYPDEDNAKNSDLINNYDTISRQDAIELVKDVCDAIMSGCESWYDPEIKDEVYKDIREVNAILKCNKEVRIALRNMPSAHPEQAIKDCRNCKYGRDYDNYYLCYYSGDCNDWDKWEPSAEPERLTDDDLETIRIHLNAWKEKLCNQQRWEEAEEYQRIIDRFMAFASAQPELVHNLHTTCTDAISRQAAIDAIVQYLGRINRDFKNWEGTARIILDHVPSAQPERKKGHWVEIGDEPYDEWECDVCGFVIDGSGCIDPEEYRDVYRFCPRCGADMRGEQE